MNNNKFSNWINCSETVEEFLSVGLLIRIGATLGSPAPASGEALPLLWHWAFFQPAREAGDLGADGHPATGGFLPPAGNRSRMWAGSRLDFLRPLVADKYASRASRITSIQEKVGQAGELLFVTVEHTYIQEGVVCVREEQDIVYREPSPPKLTNSDALPAADWAEEINPDPVLLFRYSAATFNGHRIHYDQAYAREVEGYPGLVVHGPLIASLNLQAFCRAHPQAVVKRFVFRGVRPLLLPASFVVGGRLEAPGHALAWAGNQDGLAQSAEVFFDN